MNMPATPSSPRRPPRLRRSGVGPARRERGAALVVGMILLLVLTLLAVSGMNTASTELIMAGNEQYQERAFQAAEVGVEQALRGAAFNPGTAQETFPLVPTVVPTTPDTYQTFITPQPGVNRPQSAMWGNSWNSFSTFHFEIRSQGATLVRNARSVHTQGMFYLSPYQPGTPPPLNGVPGLSPP